MNVPGRSQRIFEAHIREVAPQTIKRSPYFDFFVLAVKTLALVLFYYCFSISLTFYNKWLLGTFHYPLTVTIYHLVLKFIIAVIVRQITQLVTKKKPLTLGWGLYLKKVAPTGLASSLDIGLSNWSFLFITVSLYTMSKSSAIIFILVFAIIFKLEEFRVSLIAVILLIAVGLFLFTYKSTQFNLEGFILVMTASSLSGIRWSMAQLLTQKEEIGLSNPVDLVYHLQPIMIVGLIPLAIAFEGLPVVSTEQFLGYTDQNAFIYSISILSLGACLAFMLGVSEYLLLGQTSSLTLSIAGIFKEICTLYIATQYVGDILTPINAVGMVICLSGITLHVILKAARSKKQGKSHSGKDYLKEDSENGEAIQMLVANGEANDDDDDEDDEEIFDARMHKGRRNYAKTEL
ncbi:solute carrier family 35 member C2-like [Saccoglossus kowalevskii]|uniref:Solute carrier family 35 member C2-like n=1 Tax=Saccoglossus kowalevskii TaxID=10224 RepID=A0ABM0GR37_SACKO|nr:PREDICTED: solute carrier family 35 member C2-like [Saccoglossus kowalevskii]